MILALQVSPNERQVEQNRHVKAGFSIAPETLAKVRDLCALANIDPITTKNTAKREREAEL